MNDLLKTVIERGRPHVMRMTSSEFSVHAGWTAPYAHRSTRNRVSDEDRATMRQFRRDGHSLRFIADHFGVNTSTVGRITGGSV